MSPADAAGVSLLPTTASRVLCGLGVLAVLGAGGAVLVRPLLLKAPLDIGSSLRSTGSATFVDVATGRPVKGTFAQETRLRAHDLGGRRAGTAAVAAFDSTSRSTFTPTGGGPVRELASSTSTYAFDRSTGAGRPRAQGDTLGTTAHLYKLPFGTERRDYTAWDDTAEREVPLRFEGERDLDGLHVLVFSRDVPPTDLGVLPVFQAVPGSFVGRPETPSIPAHKWYESRGSRLYVEPVTGTFVGGQSSPHLWARTTGPLAGLEVDLLTVDAASPDQASAARLVADAAHSREQVLRLRRAPWVLGAPGLGLVAVALLGGRRRRGNEVSPDLSGRVPTEDAALR
jgi:hypothetical protein